MEQHRPQLQRIGFGAELNNGEMVLPAIVGPISRFNAEGKQIVRRDLPMETAYRQVEWHWTEHHGQDEVERSDFRDVPYQRYPRDLIAPPSLEIQILSGTDDREIAVVSPILYNDQHREAFIHAINLFLEIFGECQLFNEELTPLIVAPIRRLNWNLLPPGEYPWERLREQVQPIIDRARRGNQPVIAHRLRLLNEARPEFVAVGRGGFTGYIVFAYPSKNLYVLESTLYGNATYVFERDWQTLSQMSKADILNQDL